jgi:hypothetical protein
MLGAEHTYNRFLLLCGVRLPSCYAATRVQKSVVTVAELARALDRASI